jgi:hypothetical protein
MDTETIWVGIIIPIVIGPLAVFFKSLYDNYKNNKNETLKLKYNEKLDSLKHQLNEFYYPLYIKLICLYNYDYNIPILSDTLKNMENCDNHDCSSKEQTEDSSDCEETNICRGYYLKSNNSYHKCNNVIPINSIEDICKQCRWKSCYGMIKLQLEETKNNVSETNVVVDMNVLNIDDELEENKMQSKLNKMDFLKPINKKELCDENTKQEIKKNIKKLYIEVKEILSNKMLLANPNVYMKEHFIQLLKYIDLYLVSESCECDLSIQKKFGIKNNMVKVLKIVEKRVYKLNRKYLKLVKNGPFNTT